MIDPFEEIMAAKGHKRYIVTWYCDVAKPSKYSRYRISVGICGKSGGVAFVALYNPKAPVTQEALKPLVIRDLWISKGVCEDSKWCVNLECPLNRATVQYFRKRGLRTKKELDGLHRTVKGIQEKLGLKPGKDMEMIVYPQAPLYIKREK